MTAIDLPAADEAAEPPRTSHRRGRELLAEGREQGYLTAEHIAERAAGRRADARSDREHLHVLATRASRSSKATRRPRSTTPTAMRKSAPALDLSLKTPSSDPVRMYLQRDRQGAAAHGRPRGLAGQAHRAPRHGGQAPADRGQPAPGRLDRQALHRPRHAACSISSRRATSASSAPSRSSTTASGYKFSTYATWWIRQAITRGHGRPGAAPSASRCTWSRRSTSSPRPAPAPPGPGPRAHPRGDRRRDGHHAAEGARDPQDQPGAGEPRDAGRRRGRLPARRLHRRRGGRWSRSRRSARSCSRRSSPRA